MTALDSFRLDGKVAVVTGGAGILGKNFCRGLADAGAAIAVVDLLGDAATTAAKDLGERAAGFACDVSSPESVARMVAAVLDRFGKIDVLLNNAATRTSDAEKCFAPFEEYSLEIWREMMSVNIDGMFLVAQAVGREMVRAGNGGSIIQTASIYGVVAPDHRIYEGSSYLGRPINTPAPYAASKGAVVALTRYLSTYWAPQRIRVNTITPGGVESGQNDLFREKYSARVPLGRMARADEMVGAMLFLASDSSAYVTGHNLVVDGGWTAW